jgi:hypothetical protein
MGKPRFAFVCTFFRAASFDDRGAAQLCARVGRSASYPLSSCRRPRIDRASRVRLVIARPTPALWRARRTKHKSYRCASRSRWHSPGVILGPKRLAQRRHHPDRRCDSRSLATPLDRASRGSGSNLGSSTVHPWRGLAYRRSWDSLESVWSRGDDCGSSRLCLAAFEAPATDTSLPGSTPLSLFPSLHARSQHRDPLSSLKVGAKLPGRRTPVSPVSGALRFSPGSLEPLGGGRR